MGVTVGKNCSFFVEFSRQQLRKMLPQCAQNSGKNRGLPRVEPVLSLFASFLRVGISIRILLLETALLRML